MKQPYVSPLLSAQRPWLGWCFMLFLLAGLGGPVRAQQGRPAPYFVADATAARAATTSPLVARLKQYRAYSLDLPALRAALVAAPQRSQSAIPPLSISLPMPDGTSQRFSVWEAPLLAPALAAQYPDLHTYGGRGLDDPTALLSLTVSPGSFQAQVLSEQPTGAAYLEMASQTDALHYLSYYAHDVLPPPNTGKSGCGAGLLPPVPQPSPPAHRNGPNSDNSSGASNFTQPVGPTLTVYRLVVNTTKEYTNGRSNTDVMADVTALINNVRIIQERDLAVTMTLVNTHFYQVGADGGYDQTSDLQMIDQNRTNVEAEFGASSFDLGHLFATSGSGLAYLGVVGTTAGTTLGGTPRTYKAGAVSGDLNRTSPASYFSTSVVAHEMGHQFSATHTFSTVEGSCAQFPGATALEPGKGSTIMAYTDGGCDSPNNNAIQTRSDDYYHTGSVEQMRNYIEAIAGVGTAVSSGNSAPTVTVPGNRTIPQGTPFKLTATATDPDGADVLRSNWEELDTHTAGADLNTAQVAGNTVPLFRSVLPTIAGATRYFPSLSNLGGSPTASTSTTERLPTVARPLKLRCTTRDYHAVTGAAASYTASGIMGGLALSPTMTLTVSAANATPFAVMAPNTAVNWTGGTAQTVTWNGVGTKTSAVNCQTVNVRLSTDGGLTYPTVLAAGVPNMDGTGSVSVTAPSLTTATARVMVEAADNYFFDISDANFSITAPAGPAITSLSPGSGPAGTLVTIAGAGFGTTSTDLSVTFGGVAATISGTVTNTSFTVTVPATALTDVVVVTKTGTGAGTANGGVFQVTPVITSLSPTAGPVGTSVVVSGNSFGGTTRVSFNGTETTSFTLNTAASPNTITVLVPAGATNGPLVVYTAGGASNSLTFTVIPFMVSMVTPTANARAAQEYINIVATLNAPVSNTNGTLVPLNVTSLQAGGRKAGTTTTSGNTITFTPTTRFKAGEVVQVSLTTAATSSAGATLTQGYTSQFTVRSRGTSGLNPANSGTVGAGPRGMAAGDLNGDGCLDLVVANYNGGGTGSVSVLLNNGSGGYPAGNISTISTGIDAGAEFVLLGDFNNDAKLDLVVVCSGGGTSSKIDVLQGAGDGTFASGTSLAVEVPGAPAVGDLNGDGNLDLVVPYAYTNVGRALVALGNGSLGFVTSLYTDLANGPRSVALADLNGDGRLDMIAATQDGGNGDTNGSVSIRRGNGTGSFLPAADATSQELSATGVFAVAVADFTGDGYVDVAASRPFGTNTPLNVWPGTATGTLNTTPLSLSPGGQVLTLSTGDYNGDGTIDLLAPRSGSNPGRVQAFSYSGSAFSSATSLLLAGAIQPRTVALADLNNDGALDFVVPSSNGSTIQVALAMPTGAPLPVVLNAFTATLAGQVVQVQWQTASERNSARFDVERSTDGTGFEHLSSKDAAGSSSAPRSYELLDSQLPAGTSTLYYRLRQVDLDGTFAYSPVRSVARNIKAGLALYPNPTKSTATLTGTTPGTPVRVFDALGRPVATATADATGTAALVLPQGLAAGVYMVRAGTHALRLVVE